MSNWNKKQNCKIRSSKQLKNTLCSKNIWWCGSAVAAFCTIEQTNETSENDEQRRFQSIFIHALHAYTYCIYIFVESIVLYVIALIFPCSVHGKQSNADTEQHSLFYSLLVDKEFLCAKLRFFFFLLHIFNEAA